MSQDKDQTNTPPNEAYGTEGEAAMKAFKKKWKKWNNSQKMDTLLNMLLGVAYRLDILATVVDGIPDVQKMKDQSKDMIMRDKASAMATASKTMTDQENKD